MIPRRFSFFSALSAGIISVFAAFSILARAAVAIAFPAAVPREVFAAPPAAPRVLGLPSLRAFRDSVLSRLGDGRQRSPLSVAFVT